MSRSILLLSLAMTACQGPETGLDKTIMTGTAVIPPVTLEEVDRAGSNDDVTTAQGLGPDESTLLSYRAVKLPGKVREFGRNGTGQLIDADSYGFSPVVSGPLTVWFTFTAPGAATDTATGYADNVVYQLDIVDPALFNETTGEGIYYSTTTDGLGGAFTFTWDALAGAEYVVRVVGLVNEAGGEGNYELAVSGSAPQDDTVLVGAYLEGDPAVASAPVGGTTVNNWVWDEATLTWTGQWEALFMRSVVYPEPADDTAAVGDPTVDENLSSVFLFAGTLQTLNKAPSAGSLYSTTSVEVTLTHGDVAVADALVLDDVFPKVIGQTVTEVEPDATLAEVVFNDKVGVYTLNFDTLACQELGMLSGLGYVDLVDGTNYFGAASGWNGDNDSDCYAFTVPESMYVSMAGSWPDAAADIDFGIWGDYDPYGVLDYFSSFGDSYCLTGDNPELCETVVPLEPEITYYLIALGYLGTDDQPYHIELEWLAP